MVHTIPKNLKFADLPSSTRIGTDCRATFLSALLRKGMGAQAFFSHWADIDGHTSSGKLLATEEHAGLLRMSRIMNADAMANDLCSARDRSRYDPHTHPTKAKGWEVRTAEIDGKTVVIVFTAWVERAF